ncbi:MAG: translocation/assembly module TamB domain-containing protein [Melioribacteraceae bacterium]|nr:translocation/assembly module TamB domain-containing protein [Melioribacteraceae bacterium]
MTDKTEKKRNRALYRKIINGILLFFAAIVMFFVLFFGVSQTSTFRNYLREEIISTVNNSINGKLNIKGLDGTILTSIFLRDVSLAQETDTILTAKKIEISASPHKLLFKIIYLRKIELSDVYFANKEDENGIPILSKLTMEDSVKTEVISEAEQTDSTSVPFPFMIQIDNLDFNNVNFVNQKYEFRNSTAKYETINSDDLRVSNLNLRARAIANLPKSTVNLIIEEFQVEPNFQNFNLQHLSGRFTLTENFAEVSNLHIITGSTDLLVTAKLDSLNLLSGVELKDFNEYPISLNLNAKSFNFDDLSSFLESTDLLNGTLSLGLEAKGQFGSFDIQRLNLEFQKSKFNLSGKLLNLHTPEKLFIDCKVENSSVYLDDIHTLLPKVNLPDYKYIDLKNFNAVFKGEPIDFYAKVKADLTEGYIGLEGKMNLKPDAMEYDLKFNTKNVNLFSIIGMPTRLNSKGIIKGAGTSPDDLNTNLLLDVFNSKLSGFDVEYLNVKTEAKNKLISYDIKTKIEECQSTLSGMFDFGKGDEEVFDISANIDSLNLATFTKDSSNISNLNFNFELAGQNLDPDNTKSRLTLALEDSYFNKKPIDYTDIDILVWKGSDGINRINMVSDFLDFNIYGDFSIKDASKIMSYQSTTIIDIINNKVEELNPVAIIVDSTVIKAPVITEDFPEYVKTNTNFNFDFTFKNFELISILINSDDINVEGSGYGSVKNDSANFSINTTVNVNSFSMLSKTPVYLSETETKLHFSRNHGTLLFDDLFGTASISGRRFYSGSSINNFAGDIIFNQSKIFFNVYSEIDTLLEAELQGDISLFPNKNIIDLETIWINYGDIEWENSHSVQLVAMPNSYMVSELELLNNDAKIKLDGTVFQTGEIEAYVDLKNFDEAILKKYIPVFSESDITTSANLVSIVSGTLDEPKIDFSLNVNDITFENVNLGSLICDLKYSDKILSSDIKFIDSTFTGNNPNLALKGYFPIDLKLGSVEERINLDAPVLLELKSEDFNLETFGNTLPVIKNQKGLLKADVLMTGSLDYINYSGELELPNFKFTARANNLDYSVNSKLFFVDDKAEIEKFEVRNVNKKNFNTLMTGSGYVQFDGITVDEIEFRLNGEIPLLEEKSRITSPVIYGELLVASEDDLVYTYKSGKSGMSGSVLVKDASIIYSNEKANFQNTSSDFNYVFYVDSSKIDYEQIKFQKLLEAARKEEAAKQKAKIKVPAFDYQFNVKIENQANMRFIISQAVNQKLDVDVAGEFLYSSKNGIIRSQGEFTILPGSTLDLIKVFDAEGSLRFESDIADPYLDIIAVYRSEYIANDQTVPEDVAVKLNIAGPLSELGKTLSENPNNIVVYKGASNIENNIPDPKYDAADAFTFILTGRLDQSEALVGLDSDIKNLAVNSTLGTVFTTVANSMVGNLVSNIQVKDSGYNQKKYSVSGKYKNVKYTFGGRTEEFNQILNDIGLNNTEIKVEYFVSPQFIIRLENKLPIITNWGSQEFVKELGVKYKFEF